MKQLDQKCLRIEVAQGHLGLLGKRGCLPESAATRTFGRGGASYSWWSVGWEGNDASLCTDPADLRKTQEYINMTKQVLWTI